MPAQVSPEADTPSCTRHGVHGPPARTPQREPFRWSDEAVGDARAIGDHRPTASQDRLAPEHEEAVDLLLHRERARHRSERGATGAQLRDAAGRPAESLLDQLKKDLSWAGAAVLRALERLELGEEPSRLHGNDVETCDHTIALAAAAESLRSALACQLALELHHANHGQDG